MSSRFLRLWAGLIACLCVCTIALPAAASDPLGFTAPKPNIAATPPMGWNSWNHFGCDINEAKVRAAADAMASSGLKAVGYQYIIIDDCWQKDRDAAGFIRADPDKFPSGIKALADYVHARGLKFGIYSDAGSKTCGGRPGSAGHEYQDAHSYAEWGVDYLKYDWCFTKSRNAEAAYMIMADALRTSGRDIVFSLCEWGENAPRTWAAPIGHLWRTTGDISDTWVKGPKSKPWESGVMDLLDQQVGLWADSGPNHWNDPDMLEVGNGGMSPIEYRAHFSLWAMLAAPLIAGNDLSKMDADTLAILTNADVIAIDQDRLGQQGRRIAKSGNDEIWARPLSGGDMAVILLNRGEAAHAIGLDWSTLNLPKGLKVEVRDLWSKAMTHNLHDHYEAMVPSHGVVMIRLSPKV